MGVPLRLSKYSVMLHKTWMQVFLPLVVGLQAIPANQKTGIEEASRAMFCSCNEVTIASSGLAAENQASTLGKYEKYVTIWEGYLDIYKKVGEEMYLTVDPNSSPMIYWVHWVISDQRSNGPNDFTHVNVKHTNEDGLGIICGWEEEGWEVKTPTGDWETDSSFSVTCTG